MTERKKPRIKNRVALRDRITSTEVAGRVWVDSMEEWLRMQRLWSYGHVWRRGEDAEVGRVLRLEEAGTQGRGQLARKWKDVLENDTRVVDGIAEGDGHGYGGDKSVNQ